MAGLSTNAPGLWGGFAGLLYGSTSLSTPPGFLADATPAWVPAGGVLAFEFDNGLGYNSRNLATTTPDSILTYTAPSPKLVYGSDGVLRYAPHNLFIRSHEFDGVSWTKNAVTVAADTDAAPVGSALADTLTASAGVGTIPRIVSASAPQTPTGIFCTTSIYAKAGTYSFIQFYINNQAADFANFDLTSGVVGTKGATTTSSIESLGNGWYRCIMGYTPASTDRYPLFMLGASASATRAQTWSPAGTETVILTGAQFCYGSSALTYIPTTAAAVYSLPIDHNPTTFAPLGVLIEEERKNLLTYSEQFDNAIWLKTRSTVTANAITAPNGTLTADKLIPSVDNSSHYIIQTGVAISTATAYTMSVYAKAGEYNWIAITSENNTDYVSFDLANGVVGTQSGAAGTITDVGNGWYRITCTDTSVDTSGTFGIYVLNATAGFSFAGNASDGLYIWGAQAE